MSRAAREAESFSEQASPVYSWRTPVNLSQPGGAHQARYGTHSANPDALPLPTLLGTCTRWQLAGQDLPVSFDGPLLSSTRLRSVGRHRRLHHARHLVSLALRAPIRGLAICKAAS